MQSYQTAPAEGGEILVVDDMREVSGVIASLLQMAGYTPREAHSGQEAIALFEANSDKFVLAIIDIQLRDLSGLDVMRRLRRRRPFLPMIFISGSPLPSHADDLDAEFLMKPFRVEELDVAVQKTLDRYKGTSGNRNVEILNNSHREAARK
jgi:DNA-binding response OmpR family regulator